MNHRLPLSQMFVLHHVMRFALFEVFGSRCFPKRPETCTRHSHPGHTWCVSHFQPAFVPCVGQKSAFKPKQQKCLCICHLRLTTWSQDFCHQGLDRRCHATGWPRGWKDPPKHRPAGWTIDSNKITEEPILHYLGKPPLPITNYHNHSV